MAQLLMPKASAVWLIDNTSLSFDQIADLCGPRLRAFGRRHGCHPGANYQPDSGAVDFAMV